ncbi:hypothetical protein [Pseudooceanicola algae]|uniref:Uncharacterized protein n=1 Tax=Pseudooceanicola algae TaxID=1537215 RepID=A0A418SDC2_9RHOB|nr:hypothetical protein [Pseudooceanicola algae]QPM89369.1 hypothetical protein PSAL_005850 [Pseudooceanicola algae]
MMVQRSFPSLHVVAAKREVSILHLIEWAFQREFASIEFDDVMASMPGQAPAFGMEYVMIERARLGCRVDGGGRSDPHPDADAVAAALAVLPEGCGGRQMAVTIAELARLGTMPDWGKGLKTRCVPVGWQSCKHGMFAKTERVNDVRYFYRGRWREVESRMCPVIIVDDARRLASLRRRYLLWWGALLDLRESFRLYGGLTSHSVTLDMPPRRPWENTA